MILIIKSIHLDGKHEILELEYISKLIFRDSKFVKFRPCPKKATGGLVPVWILICENLLPSSNTQAPADHGPGRGDF